MGRPNNRYTTLSAAVEALQQQGYSDELICTEQGLFDHDERTLEPERFAIDSVHRLAHSGDPGDIPIIYAVSSRSYRLKGLLVRAVGTHAAGCVRKMAGVVPGYTFTLVPATKDRNNRV
jgi:hypothetical protein